MGLKRLTPRCRELWPDMASLFKITISFWSIAIGGTMRESHFPFWIINEVFLVDIVTTHPDAENAQFHREPRTWHRPDP